MAVTLFLDVLGDVREARKTARIIRRPPKVDQDVPRRRAIGESQKNAIAEADDVTANLDRLGHDSTGRWRIAELRCKRRRPSASTCALMRNSAAVGAPMPRPPAAIPMLRVLTR